MRQILFHIPGIGQPIYGFGLLLVAGFMAGTGFAMRRAAARGIEPRSVEDASLAILFGGILGARGFFIAQYHRYFFPTPLSTSLAWLTVGAAVAAAVILPAWWIGHRRLRLLNVCLWSGLTAVLLLYVVRHGGGARSGLIPLALGIISARAVLRSSRPRLAGAVALGSALAFAADFAVLEVLNSQSEGRLRRIVYVLPGERGGDMPGGLLNVDQGGLVWYGSVIGGIAAYVLFAAKRKIPAIKYGDLMAPSIMLGAALGRVGCFLNGCCYGDVVSADKVPWAVYFPQGSVPYESQRERGLIRGDEAHSLPVHPTQLYSALDALILFALLCAYDPLKRREGETIGLLLLLYPVTRFLIEILRSDEQPAWGTGLTISQNLSVLFFVAGVAWMVWIRCRRFPSGSTATAPTHLE